jgi:hypothetical protein
MALTETLTDNFDDGTVDAVKWPSNFGVVSETGGRARVTCDTSWTAFVSDNIYSLQGSYVVVQVFPMALTGATVECWAQLLVQTQVAAVFNDIGMECDRVNGNLKMFLRNDYNDPTQTTIAFSDTDHAWWRIRETGGTVFWDTAPDGLTWTNRKSQTSPAWINDGIQELVLECHRNNGTNNFAEFDNFNLPPAPTSIPNKVYQTRQAVNRSSIW